MSRNDFKLHYVVSINFENGSLTHHKCCKPNENSSCTQESYVESKKIFESVLKDKTPNSEIIFYSVAQNDLFENEIKLAIESSLELNPHLFFKGGYDEALKDNSIKRMLDYQIIIIHNMEPPINCEYKNDVIKL